MKDIKKIDVHAHLTPWPEFEPKYPGTEFTKLSPDELEKYFDIVVTCERAGKHFKKKSHYQAILDMAYKDRKIK